MNEMDHRVFALVSHCGFSKISNHTMYFFYRTGKIDEHQNSRVGTKRYMSPEILDGSIEVNKTFESYKQADVYAFSLVIWEVLRRTRGSAGGVDEALDFALPYHQVHPFSSTLSWRIS